MNDDFIKLLSHMIDGSNNGVISWAFSSYRAETERDSCANPTRTCMLFNCAHAPSILCCARNCLCSRDIGGNRDQQHLVGTSQPPGDDCVGASTMSSRQLPQVRMNGINGFVPGIMVRNATIVIMVVVVKRIEMKILKSPIII